MNTFPLVRSHLENNSKLRLIRNEHLDFEYLGLEPKLMF